MWRRKVRMKVFNMQVSANDWAHFWIPFTTIVILGALSAWLDLSDRQLQISFLWISALGFILQSLNEALQYYKADDKTAFKKNSKKDWFLFVLGWMAGGIIYLIIIGIF